MTNNDKPRNGNGAITSATRQRSTPHPRNTLKQAEDLARVVYKHGPYKCDQDFIAKKAGFSGANNGSFNALKATTLQFEMIVTDGQYISVSQDWIDIFLNDDPQQLRRARQRAMGQPDLYKQLMEEFADRQLPEVDRLAERLYVNPKYGILKDAAGVAAKVFFESASYAGLINDRRFIQPVDSVTVVDTGRVDVDQQEKGVIRERETPRDTSTGQTGKGNERSSPPAPPAELAELFKFEITLDSDEVVHIYGPRRILHEDKERIKQIIDTWLEPKSSSSKPTDERNSTMSAGKPTDHSASDRRDVEPKDH